MTGDSGGFTCLISTDTGLGLAFVTGADILAVVAAVALTAAIAVE